MHACMYIYERAKISFFFGADLTHELFCLEAEERHDAGVASCSPTRQLAHHRLEVHHSSAAKDMRVIFLKNEKNNIR